MPTSPLLPSRSPLRIRDSQLSKAQHRPINIVTDDQRWSLALELDDMWHMKPIEELPPPTTLVQNDMFTQLLISQAILDSNDFEVLSFEQVELLKKEYQDLCDHISTISRNIQLETRIKNISKSLGNMNNSRDSMLYLQRQTQTNELRLNELIQKYEYLSAKAFDIKESLLKHTAGVLNKGMQTATKGEEDEGDGEIEKQEILSKLHEIVSRYCHCSTQNKDPLTLLRIVDQSLSSLSKDPDLTPLELDHVKRLKNLLLTKLTNMDTMLSALWMQASFYTQKKNAYISELSQYQSELAQLTKWKQEKHKIQASSTSSSSSDNPYKQQLMELAKRFESNIDQQRRLVEQNTEKYKQIAQECKQLEEKVKQLDHLIVEKTRMTDQRDWKITRLKEELKSPNDAAQNVQAMLDKREMMWRAQKATTERNFDTLLNNYDELTITAMEFDSNRMKYERTIDQLRTSIHQLESQLIEERMKKVGHGAAGNTTQLRKEFRMLISDIKLTHEQRMHREVQEKLKIKMQLEQLQAEQNKQLNKISHSIQVQTDS
ncbi:hypothetical protein RMCBS344292_00506 [Rhizopus microsporus]|nr:hypothetical protein RMCBS344292_00506 [Rhizopus microsporus]